MTEKSAPSPSIVLWRPAHCARRYVRASNRAEPGTWRVVDEKNTATRRERTCEQPAGGGLLASRRRWLRSARNFREQGAVARQRIALRGVTGKCAVPRSGRIRFGTERGTLRYFRRKRNGASRAVQGLILRSGAVALRPQARSSEQPSAGRPPASRRQKSRRCLWSARRFSRGGSSAASAEAVRR